ncbi:unnamed protein product [Rotaria magnacalcarata]|uniref:Uncharacterized protein n=1 Tax=Rotaria magnacalcarata TaxID=392030 RepID=A0A816YDV2_9BILA|nr:unnamed protein product [Rotaria magnacalcarata]CAF3852665.1 unnamed protein product [Rotaria magnacalcarata]
MFSSPYRSRVNKAMLACFGEQLQSFLPHPVLKRFICKELDELWCVIEVLIEESFHMTCKLLLDNDKDACKKDNLLLKLLPIFRNIVAKYLKKKKQAVHDQLKEMIRLEKLESYTQNCFYVNEVNKLKFHAEKSKSTTAEVQTKSYISDDDNDHVKPAVNVILYDDEPVDEMIFSIYSYWYVTFKRFMDYTALSLRAGCVFGTCFGIRESTGQIAVKQNDLQTKVRLEKVDAIPGDGRITVDSNDMLISGSKLLENPPLITLDSLAEYLTCSRIINTTSPSTPAPTTHYQQSVLDFAKTWLDYETTVPINSAVNRPSAIKKVAVHKQI